MLPPKAFQLFYRKYHTGIYERRLNIKQNCSEKGMTKDKMLKFESGQNRKYAVKISKILLFKYFEWL